jgi:RNA polymerase sigma factor (TIGR02999 family)
VNTSNPLDDEHEVTRLLAEINLAGGDAAAARLFPLIYEQLRELAERQLRRERKGHTLQPTALIHEAFLKLRDQRDAQLESRSHLLAIAALAMRRILVDHAAGRASQKRGGGLSRRDVDTVPEIAAPEQGDAVDILALDEALKKLAMLDERKAKVVELRWFAGLSVEETAEVTGASQATVKRDWEFARAWLLRELSDSGAS